MRTASILLALVVVLLAGEARAYGIAVYHDYSFHFAGQGFGFTDGWLHGVTVNRSFSQVHLGPLGTREVPFTATQGLIGFILIIITLFALLAVLTVRWKRKRL